MDFENKKLHRKIVRLTQNRERDKIWALEPEPQGAGKSGWLQRIISARNGEVEAHCRGHSTLRRSRRSRSCPSSSYPPPPPPPPCRRRGPCCLFLALLLGDCRIQDLRKASSGSIQKPRQLRKCRICHPLPRRPSLSKGEQPESSRRRRRGVPLLLLLSLLSSGGPPPPPRTA